MRKHQQSPSTHCALVIVVPTVTKTRLFRMESQDRNLSEGAESRLLLVWTVPHWSLWKICSCCDPLTWWSREWFLEGAIPLTQNLVAPMCHLRLLHPKSVSINLGWGAAVHVFISLTAAAGAGSSRLPEHLLSAAGWETGTLWVHGGLLEPFRNR